MSFIEWASNNNIIIIILPPHTTHRLQPLDVGLFQPLGTNYSIQLERFIANGYFKVSMTKATFFPCFKRAWDLAFTEENIQKAFAKPGIWPLNLDIAVKAVTRLLPLEPILPSLHIRTLITTKAIRHFQKTFITSPTNLKRQKLFTANKRLAAENEILRFQNKGLHTALGIQKKKNKKKNRLDLAGSPAGRPVLYSLMKVARAKVYI